MFCKNCGTQNAEGVTFCANCGNSLQEQVNAPGVGTPKKKSSKLPLVVVGVVVVVVVILALLLGGGGYKKALKNYFKAFEKGNVDKMMGYMLPKDVQKEYYEYLEDEFDIDMEDRLDDLKDEMEDMCEDMEDFEWEIKKAEKLDKLDKLEDDVKALFYDTKVKDLDDFRDVMDERYGDYDFDADKIKQAYAVEIKVKAEVDGDKESEKYTDIVYKYNGKWYLLNGFGF